MWAQSWLFFTFKQGLRWIFHKNDISANHNPPGGKMAETVSLTLWPVAHKYTFHCLIIKICTMLLRHKSISQASKDTHMSHWWLFAMPCFIRSDGLQCLCWTPVKYICCTHNDIHPKFVGQILGSNHTSYHPYERSILSFRYIILLRCIWHHTLVLNAPFCQVCIKFFGHVLSPPPLSVLALCILIHFQP